MLSFKNIFSILFFVHLIKDQMIYLFILFTEIEKNKYVFIYWNLFIYWNICTKLSLAVV